MKTSLNRKQTNNSLVGGRKEERKRERRTKGWEKGAGKEGGKRRKENGKKGKRWKEEMDKNREGRKVGRNSFVLKIK